MKILINVVNARNVGGGLQVVHNFLLGTQKIPRSDVEWYYAVSECLDTVYLNDEFKANAKGRYHVYPNQPDFFHTYRTVQNKLMQLEEEINLNIVRLFDLFIHGLLHLIHMHGVHFLLRQK